MSAVSGLSGKLSNSGFLFSPGHTLLSLLRPLLVCVCSNPGKYSDPNLRAAASLALAKFMLVR